ncbi:hypothetical protein TrRE_jg2960 [Triparma retinervis]|uniref:RING-type E3 ubiquitin transferase n=1 Tax=Triparma retinervis TaxID=2557542 RepID=A0A9W7AWY5_9STRA|nr:hypothetical protein TrRE_jg2960 [Triparma retinervis]
MTGIVVPSHAANRGRDSFVGEFEVAVDTGLVLLGNDEGEYREDRDRQQAREQHRERRERADEAKERRKRLDRLRNKHRTRESLRKGGEGNIGDDGQSDKITKHDNSCSICLEAVSRGGDNRMLECGHVFHTACVNQWLAQIKRGRDRVCPVCRFKIDE